MKKPPFPGVVDASMLSTLKACPRKFYYEYILRRIPFEQSIHLVAGGAFAAGLEAARISFFQYKEDTETALARGIIKIIEKWEGEPLPENTPKTLPRMCGALIYYFNQYGFATDHIQPIMLDGKPSVEFSFALSIFGELKNPSTGEEIIYAGRFDMLGEYNKTPFVVDEKTTSSLGASWSAQWKHRSQFTGYCWAAREYGYNVAGAIIRGVSILKTKYDTKEAITYRPKEYIDRWQESTTFHLRQAFLFYEQNYWPYNFDSSCSSYGACPYSDLCSLPEAIQEEELQYYHFNSWSPLGEIDKETFELKPKKEE